MIKFLNVFRIIVSVLVIVVAVVLVGLQVSVYIPNVGQVFAPFDKVESENVVNSPLWIEMEIEPSYTEANIYIDGVAASKFIDGKARVCVHEFSLVEVEGCNSIVWINAISEGIDDAIRGGLCYFDKNQPRIRAITRIFTK